MQHQLLVRQHGHVHLLGDAELGPPTRLSGQRLPTNEPPKKHHKTLQKQPLGITDLDTDEEEQLGDSYSSWRSSVRLGIRHQGPDWEKPESLRHKEAQKAIADLLASSPPTVRIGRGWETRKH